MIEPVGIPNGTVKDDAPLVMQEKLAKTRPRRPYRSPIHWTLFALSTLVGFTPIFVGTIYGVTAVVDSLGGHTELPWWAASIGAVLLTFCLTAPLLNVWGLVEVKKKALWASFALALAAWPMVVLFLALLNEVGPVEPPTVCLSTECS